jgi:hypothetical protein
LENARVALGSNMVLESLSGRLQVSQGEPDAIYYTGGLGRPSKGLDTIYRLKHGRKKRVVGHGGFRWRYSVVALRVDPTARRLAYILAVDPKAPFPVPTHHHEVRLYDFGSRWNRVLLRLRFARTLCWSPDGTSLYVSGQEESSTGGSIWRVRIPCEAPKGGG